jgi:hypothetical protein
MPTNTISSNRRTMVAVAVRSKRFCGSSWMISKTQNCNAWAKGEKSLTLKTQKGRIERSGLSHFRLPRTPLR